MEEELSFLTGNVNEKFCWFRKNLKNFSALVLGQTFLAP